MVRLDASPVLCIYTVHATKVIKYIKTALVLILATLPAYTTMAGVSDSTSENILVVLVLTYFVIIYTFIS